MKIIHCISAPAAGGAEIYVKDLALSMSNKGHDVHICFLSHAKDIGRDEVFENTFLDELVSNQVSFSFIEGNARKKPWLGILHLKELVKEFNADILHCHLYYMAIFSLCVTQVKVIYTHHNIKLNASRFIYKLLDTKVNAYIGICKSCTDLLKTVTNKNVIRIDNAVNEKKISKRKFITNTQNYGLSTIKIAMVGGLIAQKNYLLVIEAASFLKDLDFEITIAGEGILRSSLIDEVNKFELQDYIKFIGNCSDVPKLLSNVDLFAMSSAWEGLPISLIEATLTGLPLLVTNVGGCAEIIHNCQNGVVVDDLDPQSYAKALRVLITSREHREFYANNSLIFSNNYKIEHSVKKHLDVYGNIA
ncbi:glycosyltransferase [uncultured Pseudoalteromonas sp.]|uniref:glycosyltransferase n=1 Tax=uncultured Pseudoalteromonas sp. TaxID=114053 RepID=UPI00259333E1|nr:glycosyltransferase [uncultured Pseudoalteromonas sp.]